MDRRRGCPATPHRPGERGPRCRARPPWPGERGAGVSGDTSPARRTRGGGVRPHPTGPENPASRCPATPHRPGEYGAGVSGDTSPVRRIRGRGVRRHLTGPKDPASRYPAAPRAASSPVGGVSERASRVGESGAGVSGGPSPARRVRRRGIRPRPGRRPHRSGGLRAGLPGWRVQGGGVRRPLTGPKSPASRCPAAPRAAPSPVGGSPSGPPGLESPGRGCPAWPRAASARPSPGRRRTAHGARARRPGPARAPPVTTGHRLR